MAEGTSLLRMHTAYTCIVGSNPTVSAKNKCQEVTCSTKTRVSPSESAGFSFQDVPTSILTSQVFRGSFGGSSNTPKMHYPKKCQN